MAEKKDFTYEISKHIAVLSVSPKGWTKELNMVSWGGKAAKLDIRDWNPDKSKMTKGVTLTDEEAAALLQALSDLNE